MQDVGENGDEGAAIPAVRLEVQETVIDGRAALLLVEHGPISDHATRLTPEQAETIGDILVRHGRRLKLGLHLPPSKG